MATTKNTAAENAAMKAAAEAAAEATTESTTTVPFPVPAQPRPVAKTEKGKVQQPKTPFYKRPGFWIATASFAMVAVAFGVGYKKGEKAGRESANAEIEDDKIANAIGAGIASANDHSSDRSNGSRDNSRRG